MSGVRTERLWYFRQLRHLSTDQLHQWVQSVDLLIRLLFFMSSIILFSFPVLSALPSLARCQGSRDVLCWNAGSSRMHVFDHVGLTAFVCVSGISVCISEAASLSLVCQVRVCVWFFGHCVYNVRCTMRRNTRLVLIGLTRRVASSVDK